MHLSQEQVSFFHREGYLVVDGVLEPDRLRGLQEETASVHEMLSTRPAEGFIVSWEPDRGPGGLRRVQQILNAHAFSPILHSVIRSDRLLAVMASLIGPEVALFESKFLMKSSHIGGEIPWHQDYAYWMGVSSAPLQVNCMIYIDDADDENGCLQVVPRSHTSGLRSHEGFSTESVFRISLAKGPTLREGERVVSLPGKAGTCILFGPLLLHRSGANRTARQRRSATIVYTTPGIGDREVESLRARRVHPDVRSFFPLDKVKVFQGHGSHMGQCAAGYRRRELWKLAAAHAPAREAWVDLCSSASDESCFEWLAAHKPAGTRLLRVERHPRAESNRDDVLVHRGLFEETLSRPEGLEPLGSVGFVHLDCETYLDAKAALDAVAPRLAPGAVLFLGWFHGLPGWEKRTALAFHDWLKESGFGVELLGRADFDVAARLRSGSEASGVSCPAVEWTPTTQGLSFGLSPGDSFEPFRPAALAPPRSLWRRSVGKGLRMARTARAAAGRAIGMARRRDASFFPVSQVPAFQGNEPRQTLCPTHCRRRDLWRHAIRLVNRPELPWCEFGVGEGESFDWFALHKPRQNLLFGFDSFQGLPEPWMSHPAGQWKSPTYVPNRADVRVIQGQYHESLARPDVLAALGSQIGLLHVDCDLYSSTRAILRALGHLIGAGTIIIFDEFYGYPGWRDHEAKAFHEFVVENGIELEWIARADFQVAVRVRGKENANANGRS